MQAVRFPYQLATNDRYERMWRPMLPLRLWQGVRLVEVSALLDTGATVNVLPWETGLQLGLGWPASAPALRLTGNMAAWEARAVKLEAEVPGLPKVILAFAWTRAEGLPLLLGQTNFLLEYDVCFHTRRRELELQPACL